MNTINTFLQKHLCVDLNEEELKDFRELNHFRLTIDEFNEIININADGLYTIGRFDILVTEDGLNVNKRAFDSSVSSILHIRLSSKKNKLDISSYNYKVIVCHLGNDTNGTGEKYVNIVSSDMDISLFGKKKSHIEILNVSDKLRVKYFLYSKISDYSHSRTTISKIYDMTYKFYTEFEKVKNNHTFEKTIYNVDETFSSYEYKHGDVIIEHWVRDNTGLTYYKTTKNGETVYTRTDHKLVGRHPIEASVYNNVYNQRIEASSYDIFARELENLLED